ncbi:ribosome-associated heat shock protein Hsp15 [Gallaecimonas sp. GXIMD4217]|uniref:ribosome-associated heat shock protein Hsp15 n=1 Tax=Gallaecimonas sp. GXIMD4217 TaxID=3131927 RepID=UPI00311B29FA
MARQKSTVNPGPEAASDKAEVRLDKWLWAARFYKTRALARAQIEGGKVHYNGARSKPSKLVEVGAVLRLWTGQDERELVVKALSDKRGPASIAQELYEETTASIEKRRQNAEARRINALHNPRPESRPDKKQRRKLVQFKHQEH